MDWDAFEEHLYDSHSSLVMVGRTYAHVDGDDGTAGETVRDLLEKLPLSRLTIHCEASSPPHLAMQALCDAKPSSLRELVVGPNLNEELKHLSWLRDVGLPSCADLWSAAPSLRRVILHGADVELGQLHHMHLRQLALLTGHAPCRGIAALSRCHLPALEDLEIWLGCPMPVERLDETDRWQPGLVDPLLRASLPSLRTFGVGYARCDAQLLAKLADAGWWSHVETLRVRSSVATPDGIAWLRQEFGPHRRLQAYVDARTRRALQAALGKQLLPAEAEAGPRGREDDPS